jgi:hypothetical protein
LSYESSLTIKENINDDQILLFVPGIVETWKITDVVLSTGAVYTILYPNYKLFFYRLNPLTAIAKVDFDEFCSSEVRGYSKLCVFWSEVSVEKLAWMLPKVDVYVPTVVRLG